MIKIELDEIKQELDKISADLPKLDEELILPEPPKPEEVKEKKPFFRKIVMYLSFGIIASFLVWTNNIRTASNAQLLLILIISFMLNATLLLVSLGTGTGIELVKRYKNKFKYKTGAYVNTIFHYKTGVQRELFIKLDKDTGGFKVENSVYTTNPRLLFAYKGIPTYHHRQGTPDPLNIWETDIASEMSTAEIDTVMLAGATFDFKQWLEKNKQILMILSLVMVGAAIGAAYFGYMNYEMLRDGTYKSAPVICKVAAQVITPTPI